MNEGTITGKGTITLVDSIGSQVVTGGCIGSLMRGLTVKNTSRSALPGLRLVQPCRWLSVVILRSSGGDLRSGSLAVKVHSLVKDQVLDADRVTGTWYSGSSKLGVFKPGG